MPAIYTLMPVIYALQVLICLLLFSRMIVDGRIKRLRIQAKVLTGLYTEWLRNLKNMGQLV